MIFGLSLVRNEEDIVALSVRHHFALGLDRVIVVDNGSTDRTTRVLDSLRVDPRFSWRTLDGGYQQAEVYTALAQEAYADGATWVVPFDADEFWDTKGEGLRDILESTSAGVLRAPNVNFVQVRQCIEPSSSRLETMSHRAVPHGGGARLDRELVERGEISYLGIEVYHKAITRPDAGTTISRGNHWAYTNTGPTRSTEALRVLHAPLRARSHLYGKAEKGRRSALVNPDPSVSWHLKRFARLEAEGKLDREWEANSQLDGHLDLPTGAQRVEPDDSLVNAIAAVT